MTTTQLISYINLWMAVIVAVVSSSLTVLIYSMTTGLEREEKSRLVGWSAGYKAGMASPGQSSSDGYQDAYKSAGIDKHLALGLSAYDAGEEIPR